MSLVPALRPDSAVIGKPDHEIAYSNFAAFARQVHQLATGPNTIAPPPASVSDSPSAAPSPTLVLLNALPEVLRHAEHMPSHTPPDRARL